jgi:hypothetical protein
VQCALQVIDKLLAEPQGVTGEDVDLLLDFRSLLRTRREAEKALRAFCELRRRLECRHYLAFYRLRLWLQHHIQVEVRPCQAATPVVIPLKLEFYCPEAIRRGMLCVALGHGVPLLAPRLSFSFIEVAAEQSVKAKDTPGTQRQAMPVPAEVEAHLAGA